jgi:hypothetical protein
MRPAGAEEEKTWCVLCLACINSLHLFAHRVNRLVFAVVAKLNEKAGHVWNVTCLIVMLLPRSFCQPLIPLLVVSEHLVIKVILPTLAKGDQFDPQRIGLATCASYLRHADHSNSDCAHCQTESLT